MMVEFPKSVLVTGGCGFIGSHLVETILQTYGECRVRVLDNLSSGRYENIQPLIEAYGPRCEFVQGDTTCVETCHAACVGMGAVLHEAAVGSVPRSVADPIRTHKNNVDGFQNMIFAAKEAGIVRFVYASSSSVYGDDTTLPKIEQRTGTPLSPYAVSKCCNELVANTFANLYNMECVGLRYFNVFGPRQDPNGAYAAVIPKFIALLHRGEAPEIYGDGTALRDFTFVRNVVDANLRALTVPIKGGVVCNVGAGGHTNINELVDVLRVMQNRMDVKPVYRDARIGDIKESYANIEKAQRVLGYTPTVAFNEGLQLTVRAATS